MSGHAKGKCARTALYQLHALPWRAWAGGPPAPVLAHDNNPTPLLVITTCLVVPRQRFLDMHQLQHPFSFAGSRLGTCK